jgi:hypothetical protein
VIDVMSEQHSNSSLAKAKLYEVKWNPKEPKPTKLNGRNDIEVQFNPQTLKLTYSNENKSANQPGGSASQFVGAGTTKLAVELLFDTSQTGQDVRIYSIKVKNFIQPSRQADQKNKRVPPAVSFEWGTFKFAGVVDSLQESLDYFSEDGRPLRSTIQLGISGLVAFSDVSEPAVAPAAGQPGITQLSPAPAGKSVAQMAGQNGNSGDWKSIAAANGIDDPLRPSTGSLVDLNAGAGAQGGVGLGVGISGGIGVGASVSAQAGAAVGFSAGLGGGVGFAAGASAGGGLSAGAGISAGLGASATLGTTASAGFGASPSAGTGASAAAGFGASVGAGLGTSATLGVGVSAQGSASAGASLRAAGNAGGSFRGSAIISSR